MLLLSGCGRGPVAFEPNAVFAAQLEQEFDQPLAAAESDVQAILVDLFGTPDAPRLPATIAEDPSLAGLIDPERLVRAAGAVSSDRDGAHVGLYREHCSACHGISGDGRGPAALFQNPYPRDYRAGVFKYKSTPRGAKPTREDLADTIVHGLPGTGMPAFELLVEDEHRDDLEGLLDYVVYLSIRGELERRLLLAAATEFDYASDSGEGSSAELGDRLIRPADHDSAAAAYAEQAEWIAGEIREIATEWATADEQVPTIPPQPDAEERLTRSTPPKSIALGRELFHGQIANCSSCHGVDGAGGGPLADYDDWTKEWTTQLGLDPRDREKLEPFFDAGALPPRPLPARRLTLGGFRGGSSPEEIYLRILHGIDGTPMPAINLVEEESATGLTSTQIWQLVDYVLSLDDRDDVARDDVARDDGARDAVARGEVAAVVFESGAKR